AATANVSRVEAAIKARRHDLFASLIADPAETIDHTTGVTYERQAILATMGWGNTHLRDLTLRSEVLATLGDTLALCRESIVASASAEATCEVGAIEGQRLMLVEVDGNALRRRTDIFAVDPLADAVARLYERFAELLPAGPARDQGAGTAR